MSLDARVEFKFQGDGGGLYLGMAVWEGRAGERDGVRRPRNRADVTMYACMGVSSAVRPKMRTNALVWGFDTRTRPFWVL